MTILYFTATGNSLLVAKRIGGETYSIVQAVREKQYTYSDDSIGIVFPVYGLCVPPYLLDFLSKVKFDCHYTFAIVTYGVNQGAVVKNLMEIGNQYELDFDYINTIRMVETCLQKYEAIKEIQKFNESDFHEKLQLIISDITDRRKWIRPNTCWENFLTAVHKKMYPYPIGIGETEKYHIENSCNHCGVCAQVCPMNNIKLNQCKPTFGIQCISCLACTQNCPQNAIRMSNEKSKVRYRNSSIELKDIISANM